MFLVPFLYFPMWAIFHWVYHLQYWGSNSTISYPYNLRKHSFHVKNIVELWLSLCAEKNLTSLFSPRFLSTFLLFVYLFVYLFIYLWLHQVFVAVHGLSLVAVSGGYSLLHCAGFSLRWLVLLRSMGSRCAGFSSCGTQARQLWLVGSRAQAQ